MPEEQIKSQKHASIQVVIDPSGMEAKLILRGLPDTSLNAQELIEAVNAAGVQFGLDQAAIQSLLAESKKPEVSSTLERVVAKGKPVLQGKDGLFERLVKQSGHVAIREDGRADFRNVTKFQTVNKGQNVAKIEQPVNGQPGINVMGETVEPDPVAPAPRKAGKNISEIPGEGIFISRIHGVYEDDGKTIDVNPELEIHGDAGLETGNLSYDGTVRISGNIERGTEVRAGGDLHVGGVVESGRLIVRGDLIVGTGINTARDGTMHIHGKVMSPYIENSVLMVDDNIEVERAILGSHIVCHGSVSVQEDLGSISGSEIVSYGPILSGQIGNKSGARTLLFIGLHYRNTKNWEKAKKAVENAAKELEHTAGKLRAIQNKIVRYSKTNVPVEVQAQARTQLKSFQEAQAKKTKLESDYQNLLKHRLNPKPVQVGAKTAIYPGVEIHFAGEINRITATQSKTSLVFEQGKSKYSIKPFTDILNS